MALWGNNDNVTTQATGIVTASGFNGEVLGTNTQFTNFSVGQTLTTGVGATNGFGVIKSITSNTEMELDIELGGAMVEGVTKFLGSNDEYIVGDRPQYLDEDPSFTPASAAGERGYTKVVYGVNNAIQQARQASNSQYVQAHSGWVGVQTYIDCHGELRVKSETLVAMSGISTNTQATSFVLPE